LLVLVAGGVAETGRAQVVTTSTSTALPGAAPGSERWILLLKNRGYNLRQTIADALHPCLLEIGAWKSAPAAVPPCTVWVSTATSLGGVTDAFGMARWAVQIPPGVVHLDFGLQAAVFPSGGGTFHSNGLHVFVGGGL